MNRHSPIEFSLSAGGCFLGAVMLLILPLRLLCAAFVAALIHECCHMITLRILRIPIRQIRIGFGKAVIETPVLSPLQELLSAAAGPAGSFLCLLLARHFPLLALCGCIQGLYNLLPIYPLDGGRILFCICQLYIPAYAERILDVAGWTITAILVSISFFLFLRTYHSFFILFSGYFLFCTRFNRKTPCKDVRY